MMKVTLLRSVNGRLESHKACVRGLCLRRIRHSVVVEDKPATRGMVNMVNYLGQVEEA